MPSRPASHREAVLAFIRANPRARRIDPEDVAALERRIGVTKRPAVATEEGIDVALFLYVEALLERIEKLERELALLREGATASAA